MSRLLRNTSFIILTTILLAHSISAYEIPQRKIEIKPYINLLFASNYWENETGYNLVEDKTGIGFGTKIRTQFYNSYGMTLNFSLTDIETIDGTLGSSIILTAGGYFMQPTEYGSLTFECGYGFITAGDKVTGLLLPSLEYGHPVSDRISLALEFGWPIANDWFKKYAFKENYSSFTISTGAVLAF